MVITRKNIIGKEIFHVLNRGVDKRNIFLEEKDYFRFIHNLFEFNDANPILNSGHFFNKIQSVDLRNQYNQYNQYEKKPRKLIIEILAFCLMPNHFHLLLRQKEEGGITKFMRRLSIGYANYFNQKYKRSGTLFEGRYKSILINQDGHFYYLPYYIHLNPLDLVMPEWRSGKIQNYQKAAQFLKNYRWSSHLDFLGNKNFPSVTQRELLLEIFGGSNNYSKGIENWLNELNLAEIKKLILE